jgi:hypothetical protein
MRLHRIASRDDLEQSGRASPLRVELIRFRPGEWLSAMGSLRAMAKF